MNNTDKYFFSVMYGWVLADVICVYKLGFSRADTICGVYIPLTACLLLAGYILVQTLRGKRED